MIWLRSRIIIIVLKVFTKLSRAHFQPTLVLLVVVALGHFFIYTE